MKKAVLSLFLVILLFVSMVSVFVNVVKADAFFSDGFESGTFVSWNTNNTGAAVVSNISHTGNYSAVFPLSRHDSYAIKTLSTPLTSLNYTSYVYFSGLCSDYICIVMAQDASGNVVHYRTTRVNGSYQWQFNVGNSQIINSSTPAPQIGKWYKVELLAVSGNNGTFCFIVDGQIRAMLTNQTFGQITQLRIGHDWSEGYIGGDVYFDDVVAGPISSPTIYASAGNGGAITPSGAITVNAGGNQSFSITPNTGYHLTDVLVDGNSMGPITAYNFTNVGLGTIHSIAASFAINNFTIQALADSNGQISPSGSVSVNYGTDKTFTFSANPGYHVSSVNVNGTPVAATTTYTITNITANYLISVSFAADPTPTPTLTTTLSPTTSSSTPKPSVSPTPSFVPLPTTTCSASILNPEVTLVPASNGTPDAWLVYAVVIGTVVAALAVALVYFKNRAN